MSAKATQARATIESWREQGAHLMDPLRFHRIDALERRLAGHDEVLRHALEARLAEWIDSYAGDLQRYRLPQPSREVAPRSAMRDVLDRLARTAADGGGRTAGLYPHLSALDDIRRIWTRLRAESQLRQSLEQPTEDVGPLNSGRLVHRALSLMRDVSPGYLQHFLAYVDALMWLEQMSDEAGTPPERTSASAPKRGGGRSRKR